MKYNVHIMSAMNFEEKDKKAEQPHSPEDKTEKELSLSEIDELLKEKAGIFDNLDKFSKDEIFKKEDFYDDVERHYKLDDKYDSNVYAKAGFWKKYDNFTRLGFFKERYGLLKSKDRGLLDKSKIKISEGFLGSSILIHNASSEGVESGFVENTNAIYDEADYRHITKRYEIVDGEIVKIIKSRRTESGAVEAAGKMREAEISRLKTVNGAELVGLKESMEKNSKVRENLSKTMEFMSKEEKENVTAKLNEEDNYRREKIQEKEYKIAEESKIFREPLEGRLNEMLGVENDLTEAFDYIKTSESDLNKQIKAYEAFIKEATKLDLLDGVGGDVVKNAEEAKAVADGKIKEFTEMKAIVSSKLDVLKNNRKEIETTLNRINSIGKTNKENAENEKNNKKTETKSVDVEEEKEDGGKNNTEHKRGNKDTWDEVRDKAWGLTGTKEKTKSQKAGKNFDELFPDHDYPVREKVNAEDKSEEGQSKNEEENKVEEEVKVEKKEAVEKTLTKKEIEKIVITELKVLGIMDINDKTMREQIIINVTMAVETMIQKSKDQVEEKDIKEEAREWYRKYTKNISKKSRQSKKT
ncbi:MAG: hypothetical protein UT90_C0012G0005 [Parcubacteria group bacterium GW2011_GWA1_40_21]|nr:MAG: hypothetical protein UT80_C0003G0003 [Parcubacteria group bacterium GW2011_GWC1_40_13]KKR53200.1 MAG: hypothetical protein UT90_C0012G0005 [Parcubacteria group bacterium GW2011_GWA1_40_21]